MRYKLILCAILSFFTAFIGLGLSYPRGFNLKFPQPGFYKIAADGWLVDGSRIELPALHSRGNFLTLSMDFSRAAHAPATTASALVCGAKALEFSVGGPGQVRIPIDGGCEPRSVEFKFGHTFSLPKDGRALGARLSALSLGSVFKLPIVNIRIIVVAAALIFVLSLAVLFCVDGAGAPHLALIYALFLSLFRFSSGFQLLNVFSWWALILLALLGWRLGDRALERGQESKRSFRLGFFCMLAAAAFGAWVRWRGLDFGLPHIFHPDEGPKAQVIGRMMEAGSLNPHYFLHPALLLYLTLFLSKLFAILGAGQWSGDAAIVFAGRSVSLVAGVISVPALYFLTRKISSTFAASFAAALFAALPLHAAISRYLKEDALLILMVLLSANFIASFMDRQKFRDLIWAALFAGLAMGVKYTGALMFAPIVFALFAHRGRRGAVLSLLILGSVMAGTFILVNPYILLSFAEFKAGFSKESLHMVKGHGGAQISAMSEVWVYHLRRSILPGMGALPLALGVLGLGFAMRVRSPLRLLPVLFLFAFYLPAEWVKAKPFPQADRYIAPCLPFLAILGGMILDQARLRSGSALAVIIAALVIFTPAARSIRLSADIQEDTRTRMADWVDENIPSGSNVLIDWQAYGPHLNGTKFKVNLMPLGEMIRRLKPEALRASGSDYVVLSSLTYGRFFLQPRSSPHARRKYREFFAATPLLHQELPAHETFGFHNPRLSIFSLKPEDLSAFRAARPEGRASLTLDELARIFPWPKDSLGDSAEVADYLGIGPA